MKREKEDNSKGRQEEEMTQEMKADYSQLLLLPQCVEDWIGADHPARFIREYVDALDMERLGFEKRDEGVEKGRPHYATELLLKVWLYGYLLRIRSSRGLERGCREQMGLIWLSGRREPDHNTLWRFFKDNKKALRKLFRQGVGMAREAGIVGLRLHGVDGTKIEARASRRSGWHRKELERLQRRIEQSVDEGMREIEEAEEREKDSGEHRLPKELTDPQRLKEMIKERLKKLNEEERDHHHPQEPEARMMKCNRGVAFGYNAQAAVDESGMIVGAEVVNQENDLRMLVPMIEEVVENLGSAAEETVADGGYQSNDELHRAEEKKYSVLVNLGRQAENQQDVRDYHASKFSYDAEKDQCICPRGEILKFERKKMSKRKRPVSIYRCQNFKGCPVRWECSREKRGRTIELSAYHGALTRQREKQRDPQKQAALKRRMVINEPVFGWIKEAMGFRRWSYHGLESVRTQWSLLCTTVNLAKLYQHWLGGRFAFS
jgi:transposase